MSSKTHEAYSLDSFQDRLFFYDDFLGDSLKDLWNATGGAGGTVALIDQVEGGIVRITTDNDDNDSYEINWGTIRSLLVSKQVTIEFRLRPESTSSIRMLLYLQFDGNNRISFQYDTDAADTNWQIETEDGGAITTADSGIAVTTNFAVLRIECFPTGEIHYYIDDVEASNSPLTTNIPDDATDYLEPRFFIQTREAATKYMDIDYCVVRQEI